MAARALAPRSGPARAEELELLRVAVVDLAAISAAEWDAFAQGLRAQVLARGERLVRQGSPVDGVWFLVRGLVRIVRREREREVTLGFDCERRFVGDTEAWLTGGPARCTIEALEECRLIHLSRALLEDLPRRHPCWEELFRRVAERQLLHKIDKELRIRTLTPRERYEELVRQGSYLVKRVPQYLLAISASRPRR